MTNQRLTIRTLLVLAGLSASNAAMAQDGVDRAVQACERSYQQGMQMCNAPVRARVPNLQQRCFDQRAQARERCISNAQARYESAERRRNRLRD